MRLYRNAVIFEKPLTLSAEHFEMLQSITKTYKISYTIAYNRRFSGLFFPVGENNYDISFPMVPRENVLIHNLPHALDMVIMLCGGINLSVENAQKSSGEYEIIGRCNNVTFRLLLFLDFSKKSKVKINGVEMEWPPLKSSYSMIDVVTSLSGRVPYENDEKERILLNSICKVEEMIHE